MIPSTLAIFTLVSNEYDSVSGSNHVKFFEYADVKEEGDKETSSSKQYDATFCKVPSNNPQLKKVPDSGHVKAVLINSQYISIPRSLSVSIPESNVCK